MKSLFLINTVFLQPKFIQSALAHFLDNEFMKFMSMMRYRYIDPPQPESALKNKSRSILEFSSFIFSRLTNPESSTEGN